MSFLRKEENYFLSQNSLDALLAAIDQALSSRGMAPAQRGSMGIVTYGHPIGNGVTPHVAVTCFPVQGGQHVRFEVRGEVDSTNMTLFVICMMFLWPLGLYLGFMAHQNFERVAGEVLAVMRSAAAPYVMAPNAHAPTAPGFYVPPPR